MSMAIYDVYVIGAYCDVCVVIVNIIINAKITTPPLIAIDPKTPETVPKTSAKTAANSAAITVPALHPQPYPYPYP